MRTFILKTTIDASAKQVFDWHLRPGAFERLSPPWEKVVVLEDSGGLTPGARKVMATRIGFMTRKWVAEHYELVEGKHFCDRLIEGPFAVWDHKHSFEELGAGKSMLDDSVQYRLPGGWFGDLFGSAYVRRALDRLFRYRHRVTARDLAYHGRYEGIPKMKILVTGASGLIGSALTPFLSTGGHEVYALVRRPVKPGAKEVFWDPAAGKVDAAGLEGFDAVVHLAGDNIGSARWSEEKKAQIRNSRLKGTKLLSEALAKLSKPPEVFVGASAIGFYGDRGEAVLDENAARGTGFLAETCDEWEKETAVAAKCGIRVVNLRIGVVLTPKGGALKRMLTPFKMGVGGKLGSGRQYFSWVSIDDIAGIIHHAIVTKSLRGPVNAVSPNSVTNLEYTKTLGKVLSRPTIFPMPAFAARLAFGEMADEALLASARVKPAQLMASGYAFRDPELEPALRHVLGKS